MHTFNTTKHQTKGSSVIYWIHKPEHTDMFTQGYIGVTKRKALARWREHLRATHRPELKIYLALSKYNTLVFDVIVVGTREYCQLIETSLRPEPNIGWNTAMGGDDNCTLAGGMSNKQRWESIVANDPIRQSDIWWRKEVALLKRMYKQDQRQKKLEQITTQRIENPPHTNVRQLDKRNKIGLTGVSWYAKYNKWRSQISFEGKVKTLGYYATPEDAHSVYMQEKFRLRVQKQLTLTHKV